MEKNISDSLLLYIKLCASLLHTQLLHLSRTLVVSDTLDRALMPQEISQNFDEVLFGGVLFDVKPDAFCHIDTAFGICFAVMPMQNRDGFLLLGPYLPEEQGAFKPEEILAKKGVSRQNMDNYLHYYNSIATLAKDKIELMFKVIERGLYGENTLKPFEFRLAVTPESPSPCPVLEEDSLQMQADNIAKRYTLEQEILNRLSVGDFEAIDAMSINHVSINRFANKLRNEKNQAIVLNTLARKSIQASHIHPFFIDKISAKWSMRIEQAETIEAAASLKRDLLYDYCRIVHTHSLKNYSSNVRAMLNYVQFNLSEKIALDDIAARLKTNATYLSQQFNKEVGKSLPEYVAEKRIDYAKRILSSQQTLTIGQAAVSVGFQDVNYFTKVFKKQTGQTPSEYREKNHGVMLL